MLYIFASILYSIDECTILYESFIYEVFFYRVQNVGLFEKTNAIINII